MCTLNRSSCFLGVLDYSRDRTFSYYHRPKNFLYSLLILNWFNCTGKFCYRHRNFQNTEVDARGVLKSLFLKHLCQNLFLSKIWSPQACNFIKKETPTLVVSCEFCENFKNTFFASGCL